MIYNENYEQLDRICVSFKFEIKIALCVLIVRKKAIVTRTNKKKLEIIFRWAMVMFRNDQQFQVTIDFLATVHFFDL